MSNESGTRLTGAGEAWQCKTYPAGAEIRDVSHVALVDATRYPMRSSEALRSSA